jgi:hypothetical protein
MLRTVVTIGFVIALGLSGLACTSGTQGPRNDVPVSGGETKKGKASRTAEAAIIDPSAKK